MEIRSLVASEEHKNTERNVLTSSTPVDVSHKQDCRKLLLKRKRNVLGTTCSMNEDALRHST